MKNKIIYFTLISISLLIFSCETKTDIGLDILPEGDLLNLSITDTISINVYTQLMDTVKTSGINTFLLGEYIDPIFGHAKASFVCEFDKVESPTYDTTYTIDDAFLYLVADNFNSNNYGNILNSQELKVYELTDTLGEESYFGNTDPTSFMLGNIIGEKSFLPEIKSDTIQDSLIVIQLSDAFAQKFKYLPNSNNNNSVWKIFRGIYITSESTGGDGAVFKYKINSESIIKIITHKEKEGGKVDTAIFKISSLSQKNTRFNLFEQDYSTTSFYSNIDNEDVEQDTVAYIQAMGGLRTKIKIPYINRLKDLGANIVINRAELIVNTAPSSVTFESDYSVLDNMVLTGYSANSEYYLLPEYLSGTNYKSVRYSDGSYSFDIAGYVRDILDGVVVNEGLLLFAGSGSTSMKRSVITTGKHSDKMKLIISYTKL